VTSSRRWEETRCSRKLLFSVLGALSSSWGVLLPLLVVVVVALSARRPPKNGRPLESQISDGLLSTSCGLSSGSNSLAGVLSAASTIGKKTSISLQNCSKLAKHCGNSLLRHVTNSCISIRHCTLYQSNLWDGQQTNNPIFIRTFSCKGYNSLNVTLMIPVSNSLHYLHTLLSWGIPVVCVI